MKIIVFLIFVAIFQVNAKSLAQKVSLSENNSTFKEVFSAIKKQTGYNFIYDGKVIRAASPVSIHVENLELTDALDLFFSRQPFTYEILNKTIIVKAKPKTSTPILEEIILEQQKQISGQVVDVAGNPLEGVSITLKGTSQGVSTDRSGSFVLSIPLNATLIISSIGFVSQEVGISNQTNITITLQEDFQDLSDVVVTALGVTKRTRELGYAVQEVRGEEFTEGRMNNIASSLTGKIAGVDATQVNSGAGASSRVVIRGNTSLNANQQPLYVVDGMPINNPNRGAKTSSGDFDLNVDRGDGISSMNPDDIATISVLKGGAAAALYGSQAANGVILITTKKGTIQKGIGIEVSSDVNFGTPYIFPKYQYEYGQGNDGVKPATPAAALSSGRLSYGAKIDGSMVLQFDGVLRPYSAINVKENIKNFYRPSQNITNTIAFNAGNRNIQMRLSVSDLRAKDQLPNSEFFRKTANLNVSGKMGKNDFIKLESSVQYNLIEGINRVATGYAPRNAAWAVYLAANTVDVRNMRGTDPNRPGINEQTGRELEWNPVPVAINPYYAAYQLHNQDDQERLIARASVQVDILPNLFVKGTAARDFDYYKESSYVPNTNAYSPLGYFNSANSNAHKTSFQAIANYHQNFLTDNLGVNLMFGANQEKNTNRSSEANGSEWVVPNFYSLSNLVNKDLVNLNQGANGTNSLFGEATVDYRNILYLTFTGRRDWFSVLNPGFNSIFYPSVGGSFILSEVTKLPELINFAKLRSSWAQVGSATVAAGSINQTYFINTVNAYGLPTLSNPNTLQNPFIRPVTVSTIEGGFEVHMLNRRLDLDVNYYSRRTKNDILSPPISQATGYSAGRRNLGLITNKGWEISLGGTPIKQENFSWNISYNFSYNQSKIVELAEGIDFLSLGSGIGGPTMINAVGLPYSTVRANVMKRNKNGELVYNEATGYEERVLEDIGVGNPPYLMGLGNNFRYKRFTLVVDIDSKFGGVGYSNLIQYATRFGLTKATLPGREGGLTVSGVDRAGNPYSKVWAVEDLDTYYNNFGSAYPGQFVYKTDFIKLRRAVLKYNLPEKILAHAKIQSASIGITGMNLLILYQDKAIKAAGIDPEMQETVGNAQGSQGVGMPKTRNIGFNLNIKF